MKKIEEEISNKFNRLSEYLNEKAKRLWCANESMSIGWGGIEIISNSTVVSRTTISNGIKELKSQENLNQIGVRKAGGGRKKVKDKDIDFENDLKELVESSTRGDPESPLKWTSKSTRKLADELNKNGYRASHALVARTLIEMGYSLQANKKTDEGGKHPNRDEQFQFISNKTKEFQSKGQPVISVDGKKKRI